ncbi:hypothetical protein GOODEAATRI_033773, partial [Goodea atripinnis]
MTALNCYPCGLSDVLGHIRPILTSSVLCGGCMRTGSEEPEVHLETIVWRPTVRVTQLCDVRCVLTLSQLSLTD